jgi:flagella basal body P-ring formation protein FlgA
LHLANERRNERSTRRVQGGDKPVKTIANRALPWPPRGYSTGMHAALMAATVRERTFMNIRNCILGFLLLGGAAPCHASIEQAQLAQIHRSVEQLLRHQTAGLPGKVSFTLGAIDARLNLPACPAPEAFIPTGMRLWGNASVGVRCGGSNPWTIYVPVSIKIVAGVVVAAHVLAQGRSIELTDMAMQEADLGTLPGAVITEPQQALGRIVTLGIAPGQPLRQDLLRSPPVIQQGQSVTLRAQGAGFKVSAEGKAVTNAAEGQVAQVRTPSGRTVNGIARLGAIVEIQ